MSVTNSEAFKERLAELVNGTWLSFLWPIKLALLDEITQFVVKNIATERGCDLPYVIKY